MQKQEIIKSKESVQKVKDLFNLVCESGERYSTFHPDFYQLDTPIVINYDEVPSKTINNKTGQPFVQKRCIEPRQYKPKAQDTKGFEGLLEALREKTILLSEIQGQLASLDVKVSAIERAVIEKKLPF